MDSVPVAKRTVVNQLNSQRRVESAGQLHA